MRILRLLGWQAGDSKRSIRRVGALLLCIGLIALLLSQCRVEFVTAHDLRKSALADSVLKGAKSATARQHRDTLEVERVMIERFANEMLSGVRDCFIEAKIQSSGTGIYFAAMSDGKYVFVNIGQKTVLKFRYRKR
jgi:hypothetical protein